MATLTLDRIWINLYSTGAGVGAQSGPVKPRAHQTSGGVRQYAGGRQRSVSQLGEQTQYEVTVKMLAASTVDLLRTWAGSTVEVRDNRGFRMFGVFYQVQVVEKKRPDLYEVKLVLYGVTASEGV